VRHLATQRCAFDVRLPVVDPAPDAGVDDLLHKILGRLIMTRSLQDVWGRARQIQLDPLRAQHLDEHFRLRGGVAAVGRWVLRMRGCSQQRQVRALWSFWGMPGQGEEGCRWMKRALEQSSSDDAAHASATWVARFLNLYYGDQEVARESLDRGVVLCCGLGTSGKQDLALALTFLGVEADHRGDHDSSRVYYEETLALRRELGDLWGIAQSLNNLAYSAEMRGHFVGARSFLIGWKQINPEKLCTLLA
jgi:hypothetical protein